MEAMREYGLRESEFRDMEIGFRINFYRNTEDALEDIPQGAEKTTQVIRDTTQATQGTTQVRLTEEDKTVLAEIKQFPRKPLQGLGFPVLAWRGLVLRSVSDISA